MTEPAEHDPGPRQTPWVPPSAPGHDESPWRSPQGWSGPAGGYDPPSGHETPSGYEQAGAAADTAGEGAHRPPARRRRFGALALAAAVIAGGGAGAATAALIGSVRPSGTVSVTSATSPALSVAATQTTETAAAIVAKVEPALVDIQTEGSDQSESPLFGDGTNPFSSGAQTTEAAGTGMILTSTGLVLTNAHVLAGADTITVTYNGQTSTHPATLVGEDAADDIALIQITGASGLPTVTLGDSATLESGDAVLAIGNALDLQAGGFTVSDGVVSGLNRSIQTDNDENLTGLVQTSAAISSGDSGGPLLDANGDVVGMDTASATSSADNTAADIGFAIPINQVKSLLAQLEKGNIGTPTTGSSSSSQSSGGTYGGSYGSYGGSY